MNFSSFTLKYVTWYEYQIWDTQRERVNMISLQQDRPRHARQWILAYHTWCLRSAPRQQLSASPYVFTPFNSARRSQWPSGLKRSTTARLLGLRVRIPLGAWMSVSYECCVLSVTGLCDEPIRRPEESYRLWCVTLCDLQTSSMRRSWPALGCCAKKKSPYTVFKLMVI